MKNLRSLSFPAVMMLGTAFSVLHAQEQGPRNAIIVLRHGEDADAWAGAGDQQTKGDPTKPWPSKAWSGVVDKWPEYPYPYTEIGDSGEATGGSPAGFKVPVHGLSGQWEANGKDGTRMTAKDGKQRKVWYTDDTPYGEDQAVKLAEKLDAFLSENNFANITRAITMDPQSDGSPSTPTANPFDTIWPYLTQKKTQNEAKLQAPIELFLVKREPGNDKSKGILALLAEKSAGAPRKEEILSPNGGSTILCWTGEGLHNEKKKDGSEKQGVFAILLDKYLGEGKTYDWLYATSRCADVLIYYKDTDGTGVVERWLFNANTGEFKLLETHPSSKKRPEKASQPA